MSAADAPSGMVRVAVDAMGGDHAPQEIVKGALQAASEGKTAVLLVGEAEALQPYLQDVDTSRLPLKVIPSEGVIQEGEPPAVALRQKPRSSIAVATYLVKEGHADALVTMGSTGAAMAAGVFALGTVEGVERPALGGPILGMAPTTVIVDVGTSVDCRPSQLLSFGVIGSVTARKLFGVQNPRVALLSVGSEEGKGNRQVKEAYELLKGADLNFIGNVEGMDIPLGKAEVVVCDGFVGNILMKFAEGLGATLHGWLQERLARHLSPEGARRLAREAYNMTNIVEAYGGGPLLGLRGIVVVGHGRAQAPQVAQAIGMARSAVETGFVASLEEELQRAHQRAQA